MTENDNNELHDDIDLPEDFDKEPAAKPSIREIWESNPALKVAALVLAGIVFIGGYAIFFQSEKEDEQSKIRLASNPGAKQIPGQHELDPEYRRQLEEANKKEAELAAERGGSAMPTPIATSKAGGLEMPEVPEKRADVLAEWRKATEASRVQALKEKIEEDQTPAPEVVPAVKPVRPQPAVKPDPNEAKNMVAQMRTIIGAHSPPKPSLLLVTKEDSPYAIKKKEELDEKIKQAKIAEKGGVVTKDGEACVGDNCKGDVPQNIVPGGSVAYATLLNELNSDVAGPVLVQILSGPFEGGRAIGKVTTKDEYMVLTFGTVIKDTVSYNVNGIALDEATTLAGQATDVEHHYFTRVILPAAAKFLEGYGSSVAETGTSAVATAGGGVAVDKPKPDAKENVYKGVEEATKRMGEFLDQQSNRPVTVKIAKGTTMGLLFLDTVTTKDVVK